MEEIAYNVEMLRFWCCLFFYIYRLGELPRYIGYDFIASIARTPNFYTFNAATVVLKY